MKNLIHHTYVYVPPCPACNSCKTGRYVQSQKWGDDAWVQKESLKHGEIVKVVSVVPKYNLFCVDCGFEWSGNVSISLITQEQYEQEILSRSLNYEMKSLKEKEREEKRNRSKVDKILRKFWV